MLHATTITLLRKYRPTCALVQARPKFSQRSSAGSVHGLLKISSVFLNAARKVQRIGTITITAQTASATCPRPAKSRTSERGPSSRGPAGADGSPGFGGSAAGVGGSVDCGFISTPRFPAW